MSITVVEVIKSFMEKPGKKVEYVETSIVVTDRQMIKATYERMVKLYGANDVMIVGIDGTDGTAHDETRFYR